MAWFRRKAEEQAAKASKVVIAEGLWIKCDSCKEIMYRAEVERAGRVCPKCHYPFRITARERIGQLADPGSFEERETSLTTADPLGFKDTKKYRERVRAAAQKTASDEAVICGVASIGGQSAVLAVFEFGFLGGSMGSVVGEKLTRAIELAIDKRLPVVIVSASGGARMQEGILSLMQMAKTSAARADRVRRPAGHRRDDSPAASRGLPAVGILALARPARPDRRAARPQGHAPPHSRVLRRSAAPIGVGSP
jgi:acetyl-CoA carboxylase carboxyl transferase subunit beta